jgi:cytochrome c-type biogenesis protein
MSKTKPGASRKSSFSRSEKIAIPIIIIIAIWVVYSLSQPAVPSSSTTSIQTTGTLGAADFTLPIVSGSGLTGQTLTLSSLRGKVVLLEFMEPWCPHCQDMAPVLEKLYTQYGSGNVVLLSIAGPWQGATAQDAANFIKNYGSSWSFVYDSSGSVVSEYGVSATPTFLIIGKDGSIIARYDGEQTFDTLAAGLTAALAAPS